VAIEKVFVKEGIKESEVEDYLAKKFKRADYSHTEIQRTPMGMRIVVFANRPGLVVGRSGRKIDEITEEIKARFGFENPLLDVREVNNPFIDARIVAKRIGDALEGGSNYKRVVDFYLGKVMEAGAVGVQINIKGKLGGEKARTFKAKRGFIAHSGNYAETLVERGSIQAMLKPGIVGVDVKIMLQTPKEFELKEQPATEQAEPSKQEAKAEQGAEAEHETKAEDETKAEEKIEEKEETAEAAKEEEPQEI
jgi:small subunit ribosomal protein S3